MSTRARLGVAAFCLFALASAATATAAPADVEARVDASEISWGETVTLQLRLRGPLIASEPDLTPLEGAFQVLDVARSQRRSIVNGQYDASSDWTITLLPTSTGNLEIPALPVGSDRTEGLSIRVLARAAGAPPSPSSEPLSGAAPAFVRVVAERTDPYEQERVLVKVRLYAGPEILEGALGDLAIEGASAARLGEDRSFREDVGGRPYRGIERTYAVYPEAPGELTVPSVVFEGRARDSRPAPSRRRWGAFRPSLIDELFSNQGFGGEFFDEFFDRGRKRVVVRSEPLTLDVRPRPESSKSAWWLPARAVELEESWEPDPGQVRVGEALTRRVTLRAEGAGSSQLPALSTPELDGVKQYMEAPETTESEAGSVRVQEITVIPTRPGRLDLPPIEVAWWDTAADAPRIASLEPHILEVLAGTPGSTAPTPESAVAAPERAAPKASAEPDDPSATTLSLPSPLQWAVGLVLLGLTGATAWLLLRRRDAGPPGHGQTLRAAERSLRRACRRSDAPAAERALQRVMRMRDLGFPRIDGEEWARRLGSDDLAREVARLRSVRYSTTSEEWEGKHLWAAYRSTRRQRRGAARKTREGLPPLYPHAGSQGGARGAV